MTELFSNPYYNSLHSHVARETSKGSSLHFGSKQQENYFLNSLIDFTNALYISIISLSLEEVVEDEVALPPSAILARQPSLGTCLCCPLMSLSVSISVPLRFNFPFPFLLVALSVNESLSCP